MTFVEWISRHQGKDTPLGDFAYDISRDKTFPAENDREAILNHLQSFSIHACPEAIDTFKRAWKAYQAYGKRHRQESE